MCPRSTNLRLLIRNEFDSYEAEAIETRTILPPGEDDTKSGDSSSNCSFFARDNKRNKQGKRVLSDTANETVLSTREEFQTQTFLVICDNLIQDLLRRSKVYETLVNDLEFFLNPDSDVETRKESAKRLAR